METLAAQSCPWSDFAPGSLQFCEEHLCAWIVAPAEAWTNILYVVLGFVVLRRYRKGAPSLRSSLPWLKAIGVTSIIVGIFSFLYHSTHTHWAETLDLSSMNLFSVLLFTLAAKRIWPGLHQRAIAAIYVVLLTVASAGLVIFDGTDRLAVFGATIAAVFVMEVMLGVRAHRLGKPIDYRWFKATLAFLGLAYFAWQLDFQRVVCDPTNHFISGHGLWHILNAFCFYTLARFYEELAKGKSK